MKALKYTLAATSVALLAACGGGGGGGSGGGTGGSGATNNTTPVVQQTAEGLWNGVATPGGAVKTLVLANGNYFQFFGTASPVGVMYGTSRVDASNNLIFDTAKGRVERYDSGNVVYNSTVVTGSTLNYTITRGGGYSPRIVTHAYDNTYNTPFSQASLMGNYSGATVGQNSTFSIDANGTISGTAARDIVTGAVQ